MKNFIWYQGQAYNVTAHPNMGQNRVIRALLHIHWEIQDYEKGILTEWMF